MNVHLPQPARQLLLPAQRQRSVVGAPERKRHLNDGSGPGEQQLENCCSLRSSLVSPVTSFVRPFGTFVSECDLARTKPAGDNLPVADV